MGPISRPVIIGLLLIAAIPPRPFCSETVVQIRPRHPQMITCFLAGRKRSVPARRFRLGTTAFVSRARTYVIMKCRHPQTFAPGRRAYRQGDGARGHGHRQCHERFGSALAEALSSRAFAAVCRRRCFQTHPSATSAAPRLQSVWAGHGRSRRLKQIAANPPRTHLGRLPPDRSASSPSPHRRSQLDPRAAEAFRRPLPRSSSPGLLHCGHWSMAASATADHFRLRVCGCSVTNHMRRFSPTSAHETAEMTCAPSCWPIRQTRRWRA